jgi:tol-pal system protein YbgF
MRSFSRLTALAMALALSGCIGTGSATLQRDVNDLKHATYQNKKTLDTLSAEVQALRQEVNALRAGSGQQDSLTAMRASQTSLYTQVADLLKQVQALNGMLDERTHELGTGLRKLTSEVDVIRSGATEGPAVTPEQVASLAGRVAALEAAIKALQSGAAASTGTQAPTQPAASTPKDEYDAAYALYTANKFAKARTAMQAFVKKYPKHELAGNAQFWVGETYYSENQWDSAILAYEEVISTFPTNRKVPAAMLKQAYAFLKKGEELPAKGILQRLIDQFPDSDEAGLARKKLKAL